MSDPRDGLLSRRYLPASIAIYLTVALVAFEGTAVAAALPQLAGDLGRLDLLPWVITAFLFASGVSTVIAGPLIDALGTAKVFGWAVGVFSIAGFSAGFAPSMEFLIGIRLLQGAGGGLIVAVGIAAVSLVYPAQLTGRAFAANSTVWGVMGAAAPAIAALLLTVASWRWIFFINFPLGVAAIIAGRKVLPGPAVGDHARLDLLGSALIATFTLSTIVAVDSLSPMSLAWASLAGLAITAYIWHARRAERPVVRPAHVFAQPYSMIGLTVAAMITAAFASNTYVTLYVSAGRGAGPTLTAWSVFFFTIGWTVGANVSSRLLDRRAESAVMRTGTWFTSSGLTLTAVTVLLDGPLPVIFAGLLFAGVGIGLATNAGLTLLRAVTPPEQIGRAASAHQFIRNQGFTLGSALGGSVLLFTVGARLGTVEPVQRLLSGDDLSASSDVSQAVASGYATTLMMAAALSMLAFIPISLLRRHLAEARAEADRRRRDAA
ncbi:MAG: MFS transporter [Acidimicrobiia bacterium]